MGCSFPQGSGATPALCSVCRADLNSSGASDPEHRLQAVDALQSVCAVAAADWSNVASQESELKCEEDEASTSAHVYSDQTSTESQSSAHTPLKVFSSEEEQPPEQTPLMMCSVTLVDCRTMVELNGNITREEGKLHDESAAAEEPEEPEELDDASDEFCPSSKLRLFVL